MNSATQMFLGIDIAKQDFTVALLVSQSIIARGTFANSLTGFKCLVKWQTKLMKGYPGSCVHACMEATGRYGIALAFYLHEQFQDSGNRVSVVNPHLIRAHGQSRLLRNKTDKADAENIADFCASHAPQPWQPPSPDQQELKELTRHLEDVQSARVEEKNRLSSGVSSPVVRKQIQKHSDFLNKQIADLEAEIAELLKKSEEFAEAVVLLISIPGIGLLTIARFLAEVPHIRNFDHAGQLVAYAGLNPSQFQSGTSVHRKGRLSKRGNRHLRTAFYMPTLAAMRFNPVIKAFTDRLIANGKAKMVAVGAAMRKLMQLVFGVLKSGKPFNPNYANRTLGA